MKDNLIHYMEKRFNLRTQSKLLNYPQSFVTISRQCGCFGNSIAKVLIEKLKENTAKNKAQWQLINKEVIEATAKELRVDQKQVQEIFEVHPQNVLEDFFSALTPKAHLSDLKIRNTVKEVIENFAQTGGHVIVGRAGAVISKNIPGGVHIRIEAPEDWRIEQVASRLHIPPIEAKRTVLDIDKKRNDFNKLFKQHKNEEIIFDLTLNNARVNVYEAAELIYQLMKVRNLI